MLSNLVTFTWLFNPFTWLTQQFRVSHCADTDHNPANLHWRGAHCLVEGTVSQQVGSEEGVNVRRVYAAHGNVDEHMRNSTSIQEPLVILTPSCSTIMLN